MYKLYYDLHKKYDKAIKHVDGRQKMNPPRPPAKQPKTDKQTKEPTKVTDDSKGNKGSKQVVDDEVLDTLGKQFESQKEFFESQKVGTQKQAKQGKNDSNKDGKNSGKNSKKSKNSKSTPKQNKKKSRKEEEEIENNEFNQEVQRKIQEIRKQKQQKANNNPKPVESRPIDNGRHGGSEKGSKDSTTVPVSVQQEL